MAAVLHQSAGRGILSGWLEIERIIETGGRVFKILITARTEDGSGHLSLWSPSRELWTQIAEITHGKWYEDLPHDWKDAANNPRKAARCESIARAYLGPLADRMETVAEEFAALGRNG